MKLYFLLAVAGLLHPAAQNWLSSGNVCYRMKNAKQRPLGPSERLHAVKGEKETDPVNIVPFNN